MTEYAIKQRRFDLAERTQSFALRCRQTVKVFQKNSLLWNDVDQLIRSSGSVAANYLEADEALSRKDFIMRIKICRKEAKESRLWLTLLRENSNSEASKLEELREEAYQLVKIFNAIVEKSS